MGRAFLVGAILCAVFVSPAAGQTAAPEAGLIPPPAIHIPYGGKVVTEINFSDSDVLGVIKQVLPSIGDLVSSLAPMVTAAGGGGSQQSRGLELGAMLAGVDFKELAEAISGIKNVRAIVARYGSQVSPEAMLAQLDKGVAKTGTFSRVLSDMSGSRGALALYAEADNAGYVGFAYDPGSRMLYGIRIVGFMDVARFTNWAVNAVRMLMKTEMPTHVPPEQPGEVPAPVPEAGPGPNETPAGVQ